MLTIVRLSKLVNSTKKITETNVNNIIMLFFLTVLSKINFLISKYLYNQCKYICLFINKFITV